MDKESNSKNNCTKLYLSEVDEYKKVIVNMLNSINEEKFLRKIYTILKMHLEKAKD